MAKLYIQSNAKLRPMLFVVRANLYVHAVMLLAHTILKYVHSLALSSRSARTI